jgi:hypothetical protein
VKKELHLFIVWHNARYKEKEILNDISLKFDIVQIFSINWSKNSFTHNISRFYGKKLLKAQKKTRQVGAEEFLLIAAYDNSPYHKSGKNINILSAKYKYREITGGGHLVHASDNPEETEENLLFLLGLTSKEFENKFQAPWRGNVISINKDPVAAQGWKDENLLINLAGKIENCIMNLYNVHIQGARKLLK